jgi:hypothetical protein
MCLFSSRDTESRLRWGRNIRAVKYYFRILRQFGWAFCCSMTQRKRVGQTQKIDVLLVSHMLDNDKESTADDLYFGPIARVLSDAGIGVAVLYISHAKRRPLSTMEIETKSGVRRFVLGRTASLQSEIGFLRDLMAESRLLNDSSRSQQGLARLVRIVAAGEALAPATFNALRIASQIEVLIAELEPNYLLTTYEGHAWERVTFMKAHAITPEIKCFAYQHSATFRLQHAMRRSIGGLADPDLVLTAGPIAQQQLASSWGRERCLMIGSPKAELALVGEPTRPRGSKRCLVLPEGIKSEAILLAAFCFECAVAMPDVVFVLRFHPAFNFQAFLMHAPQFSKLPPNIEISSAQSLQADASSALWAIYRGSTAIIGAVGQGVTPIYLAQDQEMTIDPLFELDHERHRIKTVDDLIPVIKATAPQGSGANRSFLHCNEIFSALKMDVLIGALKPLMAQEGAVHEKI